MRRRATRGNHPQGWIALAALGAALAPRVARAQSRLPPPPEPVPVVAPEPVAPTASASVATAPVVSDRAPLTIEATDGRRYRIGARGETPGDGPRVTYGYPDRCQTPCALSVQPRPYWLSVESGFDGTIFRVDVGPNGARVGVRAAPWPVVGGVVIATGIVGILGGIGMILAAPPPPTPMLPGARADGGSALVIASETLTSTSVVVLLVGLIVRLAAPRHWIATAPFSTTARATPRTPRVLAEALAAGVEF